MAEADTHVYTGQRSSAVTVTVCKSHETQLDMATDQWLCVIQRTWIAICKKCMCTIYTPIILTHDVVNQRSDGNILTQWKAIPWTDCLKISLGLLQFSLLYTQPDIPPVA
jgi:hypothetical protein